MFLGLQPESLVAMLAGFVGGVLRGFSGFGFGMAAVPVLMTSTPPIHAVPAVLIHEVVIGAMTAPQLRSSVAWHKLGVLVLGSLVGTPIGIAMLDLVPAGTMRLVIGVMILASVIVLWTMPKLSARLTPANLGLAGLISGVLNGSTAASGPPVILLLFASEMPPRDVRSLLVFFILASAGLALVVSALNGLVDRRVVGLALAMLPGVLLGSLLGTFLFGWLNTQRYRTISLLMLFVVSVSTLGLRWLTAV